MRKHSPILKYSLRHAPMDIWLISLILMLVGDMQRCEGHGRLIEPPSRASAWRYGFQTPPDYNDHELYCGGFTRQWKRNGGKCGECGDAWDSPEPRPHEFGGQWGQGTIVRKYAIASEILIRVELTASHMGYFEFRICPEPNAKQDCLDRYLLKVLGGAPAQPMPSDLDTRFYPRNGSRIYEIKAQLPTELKCSQCLLQWRYIAGNNWGVCPDGNGAVGCGPQEEFRACSDIALGDGSYPTIRPFRPTTQTSTRPTILLNTTQATEPQNNTGENSSYVIIVIIILFILCAVFVWYLYRYKSQEVQQYMANLREKLCRSHKTNVPIMSQILVAAPSGNTLAKGSTDGDSIINSYPPVPPPRAKRLLRMTELSPHESSIA